MKIDSSEEFEQNISMATVLFVDLDGTLVSTNYANYLAYKKAFEQVLDSDFSLIFDCDRRVTREVVKKTIPDINKDQYRRIVKLKEELFVDYLYETELNNPVMSVLDKHSNLTKSVSVLVTNSRQERAETILKHYGIFDRFTFKFYRQENLDQKDISKFEYALSKLELSPTSVVVIENEELEVKAAIQAGIPSQNIFQGAPNAFFSN